MRIFAQYIELLSGLLMLLSRQKHKEFLPPQMLTKQYAYGIIIGRYCRGTSGSTLAE
jgi:uncharacterized membrane protein